jgi:hypothetical protein
MLSPLQSPRDDGPYERKLIIAEGLDQCMSLMDQLMKSLDSLILNIDPHTGHESYEDWIAPEMDKVIPSSLLLLLLTLPLPLSPSASSHLMLVLQLRERMNAVLTPITLPPPPPPRMIYIHPLYSHLHV